MPLRETSSLRTLPLFRGMAEESFSNLMRAAYYQYFPPEVQLIAEGDPADFLYVVVEGAVELFARSNGRETTIAVIEPVSIFIVAAVLKDSVYLMSARTLKRSRLLMIPAEDLRRTFEEDDAFARALVADLAGSFRRMVKNLKNQKLRSSVERLANYLLRQHEVQGRQNVVTLPVEKRTLAALLGMTPENLSRAFATLKPYGVSVQGPRVTLTALADLQTLAKPSPLIDDPDL